MHDPPSVAKQYPFTIVEHLARSLNPNIKVIISASANNEGYPTEMLGWDTHDLPRSNFDFGEFGTWCSMHHLQSGEVKPVSDEAIETYEWCCGIPFELRMLWKQPGQLLAEKISLYRRNRLQEMADTHEKFTDSLIGDELAGLKECVARMTLGLTAPDIVIGMDRQVLQLVKTHRGKMIEALTPVSRMALIGSHKNSGISSSVLLVAETALRDPSYTNSLKGQVVESYIRTMLQTSKMFSFTFRKAKNLGSNTGNGTKLHYTFFDVVNFTGTGIPPPATFKRAATTIFLPLSSTYPQYDLLLWDAKGSKLLGFQVAVKRPFLNHVPMNPESALSKKWRSFCSANADPVDMECYWVIPEKCVGGNYAACPDNVIFFEDLYNDYPALRALNLE